VSGTRAAAVVNIVRIRSVTVPRLIKSALDVEVTNLLDF
jgi:hypothetical protein